MSARTRLAVAAAEKLPPEICGDIVSEHVGDSGWAVISASGWAAVRPIGCDWVWVVARSDGSKETGWTGQGGLGQLPLLGKMVPCVV